MKRTGQLSSDMCMVLYFSLGVFVYALLVSFLLQTVVIPRVFSNPDAVRGLVGLDSIGFDGVARVKAEEIARKGWSAWELRPDGHVPAGIASIFYAIWKPVPYSVLPFNALLHAIAAGIALLILRSFFSGFPALLGATVFALNPTALEWVAQIHRDGIFICGNLMFICGLVKLAVNLNSKDGDERKFTLAIWIVLAAIGTGFVWIVRPYWIQAMMLASVVYFLISAINMKSIWAKQTRACSVFRVLGIASLILFQVWIVKSHTQFESMDLSSTPAFNVSVSEGGNSVDVPWHRNQSLYGLLAVWNKTSWLPSFVENRLYQIAYLRWSTIAHGGGSLIDSDRLFVSGVEVLAYIPRALQVGVLSPFPNLWYGQASTPALTIARKVAGSVTIVFYICLIGSVAGIAQMRARPEVWAMVGLCLMGILVYAITTSNIGTLIRFRYGFYMLLVGFGAAHWSSIFFRLRHEARSSP